MSRLIVEAVTNEAKSVDVFLELQMFVSVSLADTGAPVTGLAAKNFRVCGSTGSVEDFQIVSVAEEKWETQDKEPAGCYRLALVRKPDPVPIPPSPKWVKGERYQFGVQARVFHGEKVVHLGQTAVSIESLGV